MKKSDELKQKRAEKFERMQAINAGAEEAKRDLTPEEATEFEKLDKEIDAIDKEIERAEKFEQRQIEFAGTKPANQKPSEFEREKQKYSYAKAIREWINGGPGSLTGRELEVQQEYTRHVSSSGIILPAHIRANENTTTTHASIVNSSLDTNLSIMGKEPMHKQMGITVMPGLIGTVKLPYKAPSTAQKVAIGTDLANNSNDPGSYTLTPERFGDTDLWDLDLIKTQNDKLFASILSDMAKGCDRKITAEMYTVALAGATEVANGAITETGLNLLLAKMTSDGNWGFAMDRESFWTGVGVPYTGSGSGKTLLNLEKVGFGRHANGLPAYFSELFADGANAQYVLLGDWEQMVLGEWDGIELIQDIYTKAKAGQVAITMNKLADLVLRNSLAMYKTPDLDATT